MECKVKADRTLLIREKNIENEGRRKSDEAEASLWLPQGSE
jgi:hypothetical protein